MDNVDFKSQYIGSWNLCKFCGETLEPENKDVCEDCEYEIFLNSKEGESSQESEEYQEHLYEKQQNVTSTYTSTTASTLSPSYYTILTTSGACSTAII